MFRFKVMCLRSTPEPTRVRYKEVRTLGRYDKLRYVNPYVIFFFFYGNALNEMIFFGLLIGMSIYLFITYE